MKNKIYCMLIMILFSNSTKSVPTHITISNGFRMNLSGNVLLSISGNLINNGTITASGTSTVKFCGTSLQQIGGSGTTQFQNVELNNSTNFTLLSDATVNGAVALTSGILNTNTNAITLIMAESATFSPTSGSATSFINGRIQKTGNSSAFIFPVGDIQGSIVAWAPLQMASYTNANDFAVSYAYRSTNDSLSIQPWNTGTNLDPGLHHVSGKEFWLIDRTGAGTQTPNVTLYWKDASRSDIANNGSACTELADLTVAHWNPSTSRWQDMGGTATETTFPTGNITSNVVFPNYSPITFGSKTGTNPLPIELVSFEANCDKTNIKLKWQTASEINNNYFILEKSTNAKTWMPIDTIAGMGNSNTLVNYYYTDNQNYNIHYYRLKQVDYDGAFTYSDTVQASCIEDIIEIISIYPNPADDDFIFVVCATEKKDIYVKIIDILGQLVFKSTETVEKGLNNMSIDVSKLNPAAYYISIETIDGTHRKGKQILVK